MSKLLVMNGMPVLLCAVGQTMTFSGMELYWWQSGNAILSLKPKYYGISLWIINPSRDLMRTGIYTL